VKDSQFWSGLLEVKSCFHQFCKRKFGNGWNTRFWEGWWIGNRPFSQASWGRLDMKPNRKDDKDTIRWKLNNGVFTVALYMESLS
jgi:hypothetical protein